MFIFIYKTQWYRMRQKERGESLEVFIDRVLLVYLEGSGRKYNYMYVLR